MKKITKNNERGQALVIIALAAVALFAFAALAIDGSNVFSDRRHAQNAADTSAMAAALTKIRNGTWEADGLARAASNGYDDNGTSNEVSIYSPPIDGIYAGNSQYVQVKIISHVNTFFARVIGIPQVTNRVEAVTRAMPSAITPLFGGNAVVGLAPHDCKAVVYQGNANTTVTGSGIFANSDCADAAFFNNSSSADLTVPCLTSVGGITYNPGSVNVSGGCISSGAAPYPYPPENFYLPNVVCPTGGSQSGNTLNPGTYSGQFPPSGVTVLSSGVYCVNGDFRVNANQTLTGNGVFIVMQSGDVFFNGSATINLSAIPGPMNPDTNPYGGLLIYMPMSNSGNITINGNSGSSFTGTILAPSADIAISGTGGTGFHGQIIGYTVDLSGTSDTSIVYNNNDNWNPLIPAQLQIAQ
ncbi:MAG TPA: pilus assembly protein TadG-related protein [Anaerolineales bacterium]|nr:pilus assembly protein TadG-related protein [Anaerolineales bacterium]